MSDNIEPQTSEVPPAPVQVPERRKYEPKIPAAVRRAAARADELMAEQQQQQDAARAADEQQQQQEQQQPQPEQPPPVPPEDESWQHRYRTLQGKYDSELPSLRAQVQQLEHLIATMHSAPPLQPAPAEPQPELPAISEEDYAAYGPDFVDSSRRWAQAEIAPVRQELQQQIADLQARQQQLAAERLQSRVEAELEADPELAGRWRAIDRDQRFHNWLAEPDPFSGAQRLQILRQAFAGGDAVRTGRFFKAYLAEQTAPAYTPGPPLQTPPVTGNGHYGAGQVDLAAYASPGRTSNATPGIGAQTQRIWSNREIAAFYHDRLRGRFKGREAEANALDEDIVAAGREGRIRNG